MTSIPALAPCAALEWTGLMNPVPSAVPDRSPVRRLGQGWRARAAIAALFALLVLWLAGWGRPFIEVVVDLRSQAGADGEIFFAGPGQPHQPERRVAFTINPDAQWHTYRITIPEAGELERIRIDPGSASGIVEIRRVAVDASGRTVELASQDLAKAVASANAMRAEVAAAPLRFNVAAPDPFIDFALPAGAGRASLGLQLARWAGAAAVSALIWLLLAELAWPRVQERLATTRFPPVLSRAAGAISDPGALIVTPATVAVVGGSLIAALLYIAFGLHQSSIGVWEELYPARPVEQAVDLGSPKRVRSDEWNTQTPWVLNQIARGNPDQNPSVGGEEAPLLAGVPVDHPSAIAQPKFYGFHLFGATTGFSWWWAYKTFGLWLSFFWLLLLLTRGNVAASMIGSAWVYGSSFTQWWMSSNLPELLIAFALATTGGIYLLFAARKRFIALGAALVAYAVLSLLLHVYPPFIVPMAFLGATLLVGLALEPGAAAAVRRRIGWRALCLGVALLLVGLVGGHYVSDAMDAIEVMANTRYPGRRVSESGDLSWPRLMYGYFEALRVGEHRLPLPPTNASEASSFIVLAPLLLLLVPLSALLKRRNAVLAALAIYCAVVGLWITVPLPEAVETFLQAIGWSWSPPVRSVLGFGLASIITVVVLFARIRDGSVELYPVGARAMVPLLVVSCLLLFGWGLHKVDPEFFRPKVILAAAVLGAIMAAGVALGRVRVLALGLGLAIAPALLVNPLLSGLSSVLEKPVLNAAKRQGNARGDRWVVVGDFVFSQGLKASGLEVLTGSQMIPNHASARVLDPAGRFEEIWNRYAHIALRSEPGRREAAYELISPDLYAISLDVCGHALPELGVTHVAYTVPVPSADLRCLTPLEAPADSGVRLFRLADPGMATTR